MLINMMAKIFLSSVLLLCGVASVSAAQTAADYINYVQSLKEATLLIHPAAQTNLPAMPAAKGTWQQAQESASSNKLALVTIGSQFLLLAPSNQVAKFSGGSPEGFMPLPGVIMAGALQFTNAPLDQVVKVFEVYLRRKYVPTDPLPPASITFRAQTDLAVGEIIFGLTRILEMHGMRVEYPDAKTLTVRRNQAVVQNTP